MSVYMTTKNGRTGKVTRKDDRFVASVTTVAGERVTLGTWATSVQAIAEVDGELWSTAIDEETTNV